MVKRGSRSRGQIRKIIVSKRRMKDPLPDRIFNIFNTMFLLFCIAIFIYPLIFVLSASFSSVDAMTSGRVWLWPVDITLDGYFAVFNYNNIWLGYANSLFYATAGTVISVILTIMAGYALSRKDLKGRLAITFLFTFTMLFSGGLIPTYLLVRSLGMLDTRWAILLPNAIGVWNIIITRTFFQTTIPNELLEASRLDGASDYRFVLSVVLPLSTPIIAVISLFYAVGQWNSYFPALMYLRSEHLYPLQIFLRDALIQNQNLIASLDIELQLKLADISELMRYSIIIVASVPVLLLYPFVQKYFVKGLMIGAIKG